MTIRTIFKATFNRLIDSDLPSVNTTYAATANAIEHAPGTLSSTADSRFILLNNVPNDIGTEDFSTFAVVVADTAEVVESGLVHLVDIEEAIESWAMRSDVPGARGDRLAFISSADKIKEDGVTAYVWEVTLSSLVVYNHRRAIPNFPRSQTEANDDMSNLRSYLKQIDNGLKLVIQN